MSIPAHKVMTRGVLTVDPGEMVSDIARKMSEASVSAVPVVDDQDRLVGMLSEGDLMRHYGAQHQDRRARWLNHLAEGQKLSREFLETIRLDRHYARDLMVSPVITATEDTPLSEIVDLMLKHKVKRVAIVTDGKLAGMVSRADLVRRIFQSPDDVLDHMVNPT